MRKYLKIMVLLGCMMALTAVCYGAKKKESPIPKLVKVEQIAPNTIRITYDRQVDEKKAGDLHNYWIQNLSSEQADAISSMGKNDTVSSGNSLNADKAQIIPQNNTNTEFLIRFKEKIPKGGQYKVIICYITAPEAQPYSGANGEMTFSGK